MRLSPCVLVQPDGWARGEREGYGGPRDVISLEPEPGYITINLNIISADEAAQDSPYPSRSPRAHPSGWTRSLGGG